ncbi:MAG TPA: hypothetical protein VE862_02850 [Candidatus Acidoferrum sp.]|nr:hypothetical protein [Candidatus Acidoferrum sp.]
MGLWKVLEYEHSTARIKVWRFRGFNEAEQFRRDREELYVRLGLDAERGFSKAQPEISKYEIDLFRKIVESPELLAQVLRSFNL